MHIHNTLKHERKVRAIKKNPKKNLSKFNRIINHHIIIHSISTTQLLSESNNPLRLH